MVDVWSNSSRCRIVSVYLSRTWCLYSWTFLRYRHNYPLFYQLLNSNLFTHRMWSFKREASSENYGPQVYFTSYIFRYIKPKTQKYFAANYLALLYFALLFILYTYLHQISSLQLTVKGLTIPFRVGCKYLFVCVGATIGDLCAPPNELIPWFLTEGNTYLYFAASPFPL